MKTRKLSPAWLILGAILSLILVCVGLYFIGYLDLFIIFILIPGGLLGAGLCFVLSLISVRRLKKAGKPIPSGKKAALIVSSVILGTAVISVTFLVVVFAMAIAFM